MPTSEQRRQDRAQKKLGVHARVQVRLPINKRLIADIRTDKGIKVDEIPRKPNGLVMTTVGRVLFNDILNPKMAYYDVSMTSKQLARVISDCYLLLGRRETIELLDRMKELGFRESTRSGLSFAADEGSFERSRTFAAACLARGIYVHPHHNWFLSAAVDEAEVARVLEVTEEAFREVADFLKQIIGKRHASQRGSGLE